MAPLELLSFKTNNSILFSPLSPSNQSRLSSYSHKPLKISMSQTQSYWNSINSDIEAHLRQVIPLRQPLFVYEPMHHLVFTAPKTMAPALCVAACEVTGGDRAKAVAAASSLHLMHAAMFTHELLLHLDRPMAKPVTDRGFNSNIKLLTGDAIVPYAYELLARRDGLSGDNSEQVLRVIIEITRAMGSRGVIDGQYRLTQFSELAGNSHEMEKEKRWVDEVCKKKEGEIYACGAACGAILGGGSEEDIEKLRRFGLFVGLIHGLMLHSDGREEKGMLKMVESCKLTALKVVKSFDEEKAVKFSSLIDVILGLSKLNFSKV